MVSKIYLFELGQSFKYICLENQETRNQNRPVSVRGGVRRDMEIELRAIVSSQHEWQYAIKNLSHYYGKNYSQTHVFRVKRKVTVMRTSWTINFDYMSNTYIEQFIANVWLFIKKFIFYFWESDRIGLK